MRRARTSSPNRPEDTPRPSGRAQAPGRARRAAMRSSRASSLHALERLALGHVDRRGALGLRGLDRDLEPLHGAGDEAGLVTAVLAVPLHRHVDQAAAVGEEVRHVEDVALHERARHAAPATTRQSIERARASSISPPAAQGASTSSSLARMASADGTTSMPCCSATRSQQPRSRSQPITSAPAPASLPASADPTLPSPTIPTRRPSKSPEPVAAARPRRIAWKTVSAVTGEGSPPPPFETDWPTT